MSEELLFEARINPFLLTMGTRSFPSHLSFRDIAQCSLYLRKK